ncbi:ABC transporter permease subunit [Pseudohaliea rubra]|uniref:Phosphate transport system permease protein PstC n=1 Tax=Pseudohaliea rubra DSM 19751 TaxID=1265313 RepID=A0A095WXR5_9GAMM|nr:ABC transporter permease subunit [Pseudohaliea rubra]KGE03424.1 Phosphate transport system permease protein PstC [Pseudohaliea rubra DSM 19751]
MSRLADSRVARQRRWFDHGTSFIVTAAGAGVLGTILLMLLYLFWEVLPLAQPASISYSHSEPAGEGPLLARGQGPDPAPQALLATLAEEGLLAGTVESSVRLADGRAVLLAMDDGGLVEFGRSSAGPGERWVRFRRLDSGGLPVRWLLAEPRRAVVYALAADGRLQLWHTRAERRLLATRLPRAAGAEAVAVSADGTVLAVRVGSEVHHYRLHNPHPEVSVSSLWSATWHPDYPAPARVWQSSPAGASDEPKLNLAPLALGTFKAALYTMLLAAPLGVLAAIYTAYFMARPLRRLVKPGIELMEAVPTVVLGFIAGLWLAPRVEDALAGVLAAPLVLVLGVVLVGGLWSSLPRRWRRRVPLGARPLLLLPVVALLPWASVAASPAIEAVLFGGDLARWLEQEFDIVYQQRNALVVGMAMGFAVLPTVFSITEDAIFSVPRSLSYGSLALGATRWQTLTGVVLPTASPGIFSALMIGLGRAIGETMIVLMATGNTPILDGDPFTGLRSLSANIAMEAPEAIVGSTHFRVLFLSALLLFAFTFVINTIAELVRQRLRYRYAAG